MMVDSFYFYLEKFAKKLLFPAAGIELGPAAWQVATLSITPRLQVANCFKNSKYQFQKLIFAIFAKYCKMLQNQF